MSYTLQQQAYCISYISGLLFNSKGTKEQLIELFTKEATKILLDATVIELIGKWSIAWGPGIFVNKNSTVPSNVAVIVKKEVGNETYYCLAIAGTNASSKFDWIFEDLAVDTQIPWNLIDTSAPANSGSIAKGTSTGTQIILGLDKERGITSKGKTVIEFVKELTFNNNTTFMTSGHSLGGALSPVVAVYIKSLVAQQNVKVFTYPTAGPTSGNQEWVDYMAEQLQEIAAVNNSLDCVPRAWDQISAIKSIYNFGDSPIKTPTIIDVFIDGQELIFKSKNISYNRGKTTEFQGTLNATKTKFTSQAIYQHIGDAATNSPSPYTVYLAVELFVAAAHKAIDT